MDVTKFAQPIDEEAPSGPDLEYDDDFRVMTEAAEGKPEQRIGDAVKEAEPADWRTVQEKALSLLERTRDLRIALFLTRASLRREGLGGLSSSLQLLANLVGERWPDLHPQLDPDYDNDPIRRVNVLAAFGDRESLLDPIAREVLLVSSRAGRFSLFDLQLVEGKVKLPEGSETAVPDAVLIDAAFMECPLEELQASAEATSQAIEHLKAARNALIEHLDPTLVPDLSGLDKILKDIAAVYQDRLARRGVGVEGEEEEAEGGAERTAGGPTAIPTRIGSREEAIRLLDLASDYFDRHEPSSPVPILLRRAKRLVAKDFMEILQDLAPDGVAQAELIRGTSDSEQQS